MFPTSLYIIDNILCFGNRSNLRAHVEVSLLIDKDSV